MVGCSFPYKINFAVCKWWCALPKNSIFFRLSTKHFFQMNCSGTLWQSSFVPFPVIFSLAFIPKDPLGLVYIVWWWNNYPTLFEDGFQVFECFMLCHEDFSHQFSSYSYFQSVLDCSMFSKLIDNIAHC